MNPPLSTTSEAAASFSTTTFWSIKMARKQSVILTPTEKKVAVRAAKDALKNAKAKLTEVTKARKALDREYAKAVKASDKAIAAAQNAVTRAEAELLKLNPPPAPKAEPSPVDV